MLDVGFGALGEIRVLGERPEAAKAGESPPNRTCVTVAVLAGLLPGSQPAMMSERKTMATAAQIIRKGRKGNR